MAKIDIIQAFEDKKIFGSLFKDQETWANWKVCLKAIFGLPMSEEELRVYRKFTARKKPPGSAFKEAYLIIGRRGGKSFISALIAVYLAVFKSWRARLGPGEKGYIMAVATDRKQAGVVLNYIREILRLPIFRNIVANETKEEIELKNNIVIAVHTCSYRSLRGYTVLAVICDELAFWRDEFSANPAKEVLTALRPSLGNIEGSLLLGISTGYSKVGPLYEAFRDKYGQEDKEVLVWKAGTLEMNPTYRKKTIDKALKEDFSAAMAEYFGEFREDLETFLSTEALEAVVIPGRYELPKVKGVSYFAFVDPSGGRGDAMTLSICHKEGPGKIAQDCIRVKYPPFNPQDCVKEFANVIKSYGLSSCVGDRYSGEWCTSSFRDEGITYKNSELSKSDIYLEFLPLVMQGQVELLDHRRQTVELRQLERRTGKGKDIVDHPKGLHDDLANAVAGACVMVSRGKKQRRGRVYYAGLERTETEGEEHPGPAIRKGRVHFLRMPPSRNIALEQKIRETLRREKK